MGTKPNLNANLSFPILFSLPFFIFPIPRARSRSPFPVLVTSVKFYLVFLVDIGRHCLQNAKLLQSEELEKGNCQSLVNGTSGPYYAMECHSPYYGHGCLWKWCSLIALCFNETSEWRKLCYKKFKWFYWWSNFDISTVTKDVTVSNVRNIYIEMCSRKTFRLKATGYRCASKTAQGGTYAEIKYYSGALALSKRARSGAPWVRKFGKLSDRENLVTT